MLRGSEGLRSFCNPLLGFLLRESLDEICMVTRGGARGAMLFGKNKAGYSARDAIYELGSYLSRLRQTTTTTN